MSRCLLLLSLLFVFFVTGCFESDEESNVTHEEKIPETVLLADMIINLDQDTLEFKYDLKAGYSYLLKIDGNDFNYYYHGKVMNSDGDSLARINDPFKVLTSDTYTFLIEKKNTISDSSQEYTYTLSEFLPLDSMFIGTWLLVCDRTSAHGKTQALKYGVDSAESVLSFENDSITYYAFEDYTGKVQSVKTHYLHFFLESYYSADEMEFTLINKGPAGSIMKKYEKISDDLSSLKWQSSTLDIPNEYQGAWFLKEAYYFESCNGKFVDERYNTKSDSTTYLVYVIDSQHITRYVRYGWGYEKEDLKDWKISSFIKRSHLTDSIIEHKYFDGDILASDYEIEYEEEILHKINGELPFDFWTSVDIPSEIKPLEKGNVLKDTISGLDTLWYSVPVVAYESYELDFDYSSERYIHGYMFNVNDEQVYDYVRPFKATGTGYYKIALLVQDSDSNDIPFTLEFKKSLQDILP